jgi:hypothetical protein
MYVPSCLEHPAKAGGWHTARQMCGTGTDLAERTSSAPGVGRSGLDTLRRCCGALGVVGRRAAAASAGTTSSLRKRPSTEAAPAPPHLPCTGSCMSARISPSLLPRMSPKLNPLSIACRRSSAPLPTAAACGASGSGSGATGFFCFWFSRAVNLSMLDSAGRAWALAVAAHNPVAGFCFAGDVRLKPAFGG